MERDGMIGVAVLAIVATIVRAWHRLQERGEEMHFIFFADAHRQLDVPPVKKRH